MFGGTKGTAAGQTAAMKGMNPDLLMAQPPASPMAGLPMGGAKDMLAKMSATESPQPVPLPQMAAPSAGNAAQMLAAYLNNLRQRTR